MEIGSRSQSELELLRIKSLTRRKSPQKVPIAAHHLHTIINPGWIFQQTKISENQYLLSLTMNTNLRVCLKIHYSLGIRPNGGVECGSWR